jgi:para-nitrobenzyl esterase
MRHFELRDPRDLLDVPTARLLRFQTGEGLQGPAAVPGTLVPPRDAMFWPIVDGTVLPELPFANRSPALSATKPLIVGGCRDEAVFFNLGDPSAFSLDDTGLRMRLQPMLGSRTTAWIEAFRESRPQASPSALFMAITTASPWREHAVALAEAKAREARAPVYAYLLDYRSPVPVPGTEFPMGSPHASDIFAKFDTVRQEGAARMARNPLTTDQSEARLQLARNMSSFWGSFARSGVPHAKGQPAWPPFTIERRETMMIDHACRIERDPEGKDRRFWQAEAPRPQY